jgi:hypothetical protein
MKKNQVVLQCASRSSPGNKESPAKVLLLTGLCRLHCTVASYSHVTASSPEEQETHVQELRCLIPASSLAAGAGEVSVSELFSPLYFHKVLSYQTMVELISFSK